MPRVDLVKAFQTPASYQPPEVSQLSGSTYYPNLNSIEYRNKNADGSTKFSAFLSAIDVNEVGTVVIASNDYNSRKWTGSFWGYEKFEDVGVLNKELFKSAYDAPITSLRFIEGNMVSGSGSLSGVNELIPNDFFRFFSQTQAERSSYGRLSRRCEAPMATVCITSRRKVNILASFRRWTCSRKATRELSPVRMITASKLGRSAPVICFQSKRIVTLMQMLWLGFLLVRIPNHYSLVARATSV